MIKYKIGEYDIKDVQAKMLNILLEVDRICKKHHIKYILDGGTMLGAVRHRGFIPWDDDLDIAMLRIEYEKFVQVCKTELCDEFFFQHIRSEKLYPLHFGKMKLKNTRYVENDYRGLNINHGVYIDIFPMDKITPVTKLFQYKFISFLYGIRLKKIGLDVVGRKLWKRILMNIFSILPLSVINRWTEQVMTLNEIKKTELVNKVCHPGEIRPDYPSDIYTNVIEIEFEGHQFPVPKNYDSFLRGRYGDYMELPPLEKRKPCHNIIEIKL